MMTPLYVTYGRIDGIVYPSGVWTTPQPDSRLHLMEGAVQEHDGHKRVYVAFDGQRVDRIFADAQALERYVELGSGDPDTGRCIVDIEL